jgi:hypothetical protein
MIFNGPVVYGTSYKGKLYIGQHIGNGIDYVGSGLLISRIIKKGYKNKLITGVIEYVDDVKKLSEREIYWIEKLKPQLNLTKGGETWGIGKDNIMNRPDVKIKFIGNNNPMRRPEVAKKVSLSKKGKMVWDCRGNNNPMRRPEVAKKVSETHKKFGENHWNKRPETREYISKIMKSLKIDRKGTKNPMCKNKKMIFISFRNECRDLKWLVRVPKKGYKSFETLDYAQKYRDKLIRVN